MLEELKFKSIESIKKMCFIIPSFQRGYRWSKENITNLFDDILDSDEGYLLHSLCLGEKQKDEYLVVDGQQRLTAIYIILAVLFRKSEKDEVPFKIQYESRESSRKFLDFLFDYKGEMSSSELQKEWKGLEKEINLDFEYMIESYIEIDKKIDKQNVDISKFKNKLMKSQFIWIRLDFQSREDLIDKFGKINMGKIPLNNAELIKSELLNYKHIDKSFQSNPVLLEIEIKQREVVKIWNEIESALHFADFWAFIPHKDQYRMSNDDIINRIEYILQFYLFKEKQGKSAYESYMDEFRGDFILYDSFVSYLKEKDDSTVNIMNYIYYLFKELESLYYNDGRSLDYIGDKNLYNYISYFVYYNDSVNENDYLNSFQFFYEVLGKNRNERELLVKEKLKARIFEKRVVKDKILKLNYKDSKKELLNILLLYNIILISSTQGVGNRYNFLEHKSQIWTAEHIFPQEPKFVLVEDGSNIEEIKDLLTLITGNLDKNNSIVVKNEYALRYINYVYQKEEEIFSTQKGDKSKILTKTKSYPKTLVKTTKNKNEEKIVKFYYNREIIKELLSSEDEYEKAFGKKMHLIVNASDILEKLKLYDECKKLLNRKKEINIDDKKAFIENNKYDFALYHIPLIKTSKEKIDLDFVEKIEEQIRSFSLCFDFQSAKNINNEIEQLKHKIKLNSSHENENHNNGLGITYSHNDIIPEIKKSIKNINITLYEVCLYNLKSLDGDKIDQILDNYCEKISGEVNVFFKEEFNELILDHSIANIALLDSKVNGDKKVGNKSFSDKKVEIFNLMKKGQFVPLSTILTFSNVYTKNKDTDKYWLYRNRCIYLKELIETINNFFEH